MPVCPRLFVTTMALAAAAGAAQANEVITYSYDALGRLVTAAHAGSVNNGTQGVYQYDPANNRSVVTVTGSNNSPPGPKVIVVPLNGFTIIPLPGSTIIPLK